MKEEFHFVSLRGATSDMEGETKTTGESVNGWERMRLRYGMLASIKEIYFGGEARV